MKKLSIAFIIFIICNILYIVPANVYAAEVIEYDWQLLGVRLLGNDAEDDEYYADGVVNLRCNYRNWDSKKQYLWLISNYDGTAHAPSSLYLGDKYDMSMISSITFDYVTNSSNITKNRVSFSADPNGKNIVATAKITSATEGALANPKNLSMEILDKTYKGPIYLYIEYSTKMFVANLKVTASEDMGLDMATPTIKPGPTKRPLFTPGDTTPEPVTPTPTQTPEATSSVTTAPATEVPATQAPTQQPYSTEQVTTDSPDIVIDENHRPNIKWLVIGCGVSVTIAAVCIILIWKKR